MFPLVQREQISPMDCRSPGNFSLPSLLRIKLQKWSYETGRKMEQCNFLLLYHPHGPVPRHAHEALRTGRSASGAGGHLKQRQMLHAQGSPPYFNVLEQLWKTNANRISPQPWDSAQLLQIVSVVTSAFCGLLLWLRRGHVELKNPRSHATQTSEVCTRVIYSPASPTRAKQVPSPAQFTPDLAGWPCAGEGAPCRPAPCDALHALRFHCRWPRPRPCCRPSRCRGAS